MKVRSESEVALSCPTLRDPMDCSLTGSSVHGIFQVRLLEWGAIEGSGVLKEEERTIFFIFPLHSLGLHNNNVSCLRTVSGKKPSG